VWLHVNVRVGARLPDIEPYEFCTWLKRRPPNAGLQSSDDAIRDFDDVKAGAFRDSLDWLDHPVLVSVRQFLQNPEKVSVAVPLGCFVGLVSPHNCSICSSHSWQLALQGTVELGPLIGDGEIDKLLLPLGQAGSASTLVERPSEMVEAAPVVVNDVTEEEAPLLREDGRDAWRRTPSSSQNALGLRPVLQVR
jgi:hypothetical protein